MSSAMATMLSHQLRTPFYSSPQRCSRRNVSGRLVCQGYPQGEGAGKTPSQAPRRRQFVPPTPADFNPDVKIERMDNMSAEVWEGSGVVQMDSKASNEEESDLQRVALLIAGDAAALLLFATIGRLNHAEGLSVAAVFDTALPFLLGWFGTAPFLGAYGLKAQGWKAGEAAGVAAKSLAVAVPVGNAIRAATRGYIPSVSFLLVSLAANAVFLIGWRTALAAATPEPPPMTPYERMLKKASKSGGPLDFLRFLQSMTRRW